MLLHMTYVNNWFFFLSFFSILFWFFKKVLSAAVVLLGRYTAQRRKIDEALKKCMTQSVDELCNC